MKHLTLACLQNPRSFNFFSVTYQKNFTTRNLILSHQNTTPGKLGESQLHSALYFCYYSSYFCSVYGRGVATQKALERVTQKRPDGGVHIAFTSLERDLSFNYTKYKRKLFCAMLKSDLCRWLQQEFCLRFVGACWSVCLYSQPDRKLTRMHDKNFHFDELSDISFFFDASLLQLSRTALQTYAYPQEC